MECRVCGNKELQNILSLGESPLANSFLHQKDIPNEEFYPLELCMCRNCKLLQLSHVVSPEKMFRNYLYVTSTTKTFRDHFANMAEDLTTELGLRKGALAVDIGSNDGLLLKGFQAKGLSTIGVEPATNIAMMAEQSGVETINDFFNTNAANEIIRRKGKAELITATNVFAHVNDIKTLTHNVKSLLKDNGTFVIEIQYFMDTIEQMTFDNIYHEHLSYFTLTSLNNFFNTQGMRIFHIEHVDSHGGSLRVYIQKDNGQQETKNTVHNLLDHEQKKGINDTQLYTDFAKKVNATKNTLTSEIRKIRAAGKTIAGYGAPAKSTTLLNFCGIGKNEISYIAEDNPLKTGLLTPGTHIPVVNPAMLDENTPDYILILAWNFATEILQKTMKHAEKGTRFIIPLPTPRIV
ncbi:class I SAM-dependent methyltransferase [Candidatus Woesearchaeota archaeon]|nr:class I SAM-dependent methyltransferase [Candidatus Woesearchaeota archaeon]